MPRFNGLFTLTSRTTMCEAFFSLIILDTFGEFNARNDLFADFDTFHSFIGNR